MSFCKALEAGVKKLALEFAMALSVQQWDMK